jgi:hypothetical protein
MSYLREATKYLGDFYCDGSAEKYFLTQQCLQWSHLKKNESELDWALSNPFLAYKVSELTAEAIAQTKISFPHLRSLHNNKADAFRHCYWSALLAQEFGSKIASEIVIRHEKLEDNPKLELEMDSHNNKVGLELGLQHVGATRQDLSQKCSEKVEAGLLKWFSE